VVIRIDFSHAPFQAADGTPFSFRYLQNIVRTTFNQRRKTILNTLSGMGMMNDEHAVDKAQAKQLAEEAIIRAGLTPSLRPEVLHLEDFIRLAVAVEALVSRDR
jgi:16S rRNA A1518/A1519 N6-dimethyltransferase RsmA/KsgA/DIM1 with predicted DNA glycosylase/AP lyase activity